MIASEEEWNKMPEEFILMVSFGFFVLMAYQLFVGYLMPKLFS